MNLTKQTIFAAALMLAVSLCGCTAAAPEAPGAQTPALETPAAQAPAIEAPAQSPAQTIAPEAPAALSMEMQTYAQAPNAASTVSIQYPLFSGEGAEAVNAMVAEKVKGLCEIDPDLFPEDSALTAQYQCALTLQNSKMLSMIFWGDSYIEGGAFPVTRLLPLNIDLKTMEEVTLEELYTTDAAFSKVFFEKAAFPTDPVTSYDEASFPEMLQLQTPEYQMADPFSVPDTITCFLKPEGLVLSLPAIHATGSDHMEAQLAYADIQEFYLPEQNYWEE